jgi:hypothetical protein
MMPGMQFGGAKGRKSLVFGSFSSKIFRAQIAKQHFRSMNPPYACNPTTVSATNRDIPTNLSPIKAEHKQTDLCVIQ